MWLEREGESHKFVKSPFNVYLSVPLQRSLSDPRRVGQVSNEYLVHVHWYGHTDRRCLHIHGIEREERRKHSCMPITEGLHSILNTGEQHTNDIHCQLFFVDKSSSAKKGRPVNIRAVVQISIAKSVRFGGMLSCTL